MDEAESAEDAATRAAAFESAFPGEESDDGAAAEQCEALLRRLLALFPAAAGPKGTVEAYTSDQLKRASSQLALVDK